MVAHCRAPKQLSGPVSNVFLKDPNLLMHGKGIAKLRNSGIEVYEGLMEKEESLRPVQPHVCGTNPFRWK